MRTSTFYFAILFWNIQIFDLLYWQDSHTSFRPLFIRVSNTDTQCYYWRRKIQIYPQGPHLQKQFVFLSKLNSVNNYRQAKISICTTTAFKHLLENLVSYKSCISRKTWCRYKSCISRKSFFQCEKRNFQMYVIGVFFFIVITNFVYEAHSGIYKYFTQKKVSQFVLGTTYKRLTFFFFYTIDINIRFTFFQQSSRRTGERKWSSFSLQAPYWWIPKTIVLLRESKG